MTRTVIITAALVLASVVGLWVVERTRNRGGRDPDRPAAVGVAADLAPAPTGPVVLLPAAQRGLLFGRVTTVDGAAHEGRLRFGGGEEAFWGDYFNGAKKENTWALLVPPERLPKVHRSFAVFGLELFRREYEVNLDRLFMARLGDVVRIEALGRDVRVSLKSGTSFDLDRFGASDFDDGVRLWDRAGAARDFDSLQIRSIELLPTRWASAELSRLSGTVRTKEGVFRGFLQWDRAECLGSDTLDGFAPDGVVRLPFADIRAITRKGRDSALVTLLDGREVVLSGTSKVGDGHRGVSVEDPRYGWVTVSWDTFERVDFDPATNSEPGVYGPAYEDFPPGAPLFGHVTTSRGERLSGRLVYDLDESETTETLDAPRQGVDYTIPFSLVRSILLTANAQGDTPARVLVTLTSGEGLELERSGDLGDRNAGVLVFADADQEPAYVPWAEIGQITFESRSTAQ